MREGRGKNEANRLRASGRIPSVVYGTPSKGKAPEGVAVAVDPKALLRILHSDSGANTLITLKLDGGQSRVMVKEYQLDPITHHLLHADFYRIAMDRLLQLTIPVIVKGEPKGVKQQGGLLEFIRREIEIECLPADIPEHVEIDVSDLMLHQGLRVRDIATNAKWKPTSDLDMMIVHVIAPKAEEVAATDAAAPAAAAEPELIKKGKKDEDEKDDKKKDDKKK